MAARVEFDVGGMKFAIEQQIPTGKYRVLQNDEIIYLSDSLNDCKETIRTKALNYLTDLSTKAKDTWYKLAYGYLELFQVGYQVTQKEEDQLLELVAKVRSDIRESKEVRQLTECECLDLDPHDYPVHGINTQLSKEETAPNQQ